MKKNILTYLCAILLAAGSFAQSDFLLDTVEYKIDQYKSMQIISNDFHKIDKWGSIDSLFDVFVMDFQRLDQQLLSDQTSNHFTYKLDESYRKIQINSDVSTRYEVSIDDKGNTIRFQVVDIVFSEDEHLIVTSPDFKGFSEIAHLKLDQIISDSDTIISPNGRGKKKHKSAMIMVSGNHVQPEKSTVHSDLPDVLELGLSVGMGTVRSTLTPDLEVRLLAGLSFKGKLRHHFGLGYESQFSFQEVSEEKPEIKQDGFLNAIYALSYFTDGPSDTRLMGIKMGALVNQNSQVYQDNAFKFGLFKNMGNHVLLEAGVLVNDNFGEYFPYMRLSWDW